jgi:hypothetical protein
MVMMFALFMPCGVARGGPCAVWTAAQLQQMRSTGDEASMAAHKTAAAAALAAPTIDLFSI